MTPRRPSIPRSSSLLGAAALSAALSIAATASADPGFAVARFTPSFSGDRLFGVQSPYAAADHGFFAQVVLDYAHDPLVDRDVTTGKSYGAVVSDQTILHLGASYALWKVITLDFDLPVSFQRGDEPSGGAQAAFGAPAAAALGELRLGARVTLLGEADDPFQIALGALVWLPTGSRAGYTSDGQASTEPLLIAGGKTRWLVWSANVGPELRPKVTFLDVHAGPSVRWGAGVGFLPGDGSFQVGPEITGGVPIDGMDRRKVDAEILIGARARFARNFTAGYAAGIGLGEGIGTPDFRSVLSLAYTPPNGVHASEVVDRDHDGVADGDDACPDLQGVRTSDPRTNGCPPPPPDRDGDGIPDAQDACPDVRGVRDPIPAINGCPTDHDNDGIPDAEDACPTEIGVPSNDPRKNGCPAPADRDGDGIPDAQDACPTAPGAADPDPRKNGCPGDRDRDGIRDDKDACPDERGPADPDPKKNGCPRDVRVTGGQIVILQQVEFDINRATIKKASNGLLDAVAEVLRDHPEIRRLEVQGHTDDRGVAAQNLKLSQGRAEAVVAALVLRGIEASRLQAKGYGSTRPLMSNLTTQGRARNRRVEFHILERGERAGAPKRP